MMAGMRFAARKPASGTTRCPSVLQIFELEQETTPRSIPTNPPSHLVFCVCPLEQIMQASIGSFGRLTKRTMTRAASGLLVLLATPALAQAPKIGDPPEARNMRLAGYNDLQARSAYQPVIHRQGSRYIAYVGHHGGTQAAPKPVNPLNGQSRIQRHLDRRRHRSKTAQIPRAHSRHGGVGRAGRRADGALMRRQHPAERRSQHGLFVAHLRRTGARDLERGRSARIPSF